METQAKKRFWDNLNIKPEMADVTVLDDIELVLEPGQVIALVGPSGAGKSTVASLIMRLYDPNAGEISLDGHCIRELDVDIDAVELELKSGRVFRIGTDDGPDLMAAILLHTSLQPSDDET